jgi:hypothetical protein
MITADQKNKNILARFESKSMGNSKCYTGLIDGKKVVMIAPAEETEQQAAECFCNKFGPERFGGLV